MCFHRKTQFTIHFNLQNDSYWKQMIRVSQAGNYFLFRISVIFFREIFWLIFWKSTLRKLFRGESYKLHTSEPILSEDIKENSPAWPTLQILAFLLADLADKKSRIEILSLPDKIPIVARAPPHILKSRVCISLPEGEMATISDLGLRVSRFYYRVVGLTRTWSKAKFGNFHRTN